MQLNEEPEEQYAQQENIFHQQNFKNENAQARHYSAEDYVDSDEESDENEEGQMDAQYQPQEQQEADGSDNEEAENYAAMQSKFQDVDLAPQDIGALNMFDDDLSQGKNTLGPSIQNPQMEPIEEGYSSDESFGAQQKHKNFQENLEFIMAQKNKKEGKTTKAASSKQKRNHINLKTSQTDYNKENVNVKNKAMQERAIMPNALPVGSATIKRPSTAKMRNTNGFRNTYVRPGTAKPKCKKRPGTGLSSTSVYGNKKGLKAKMMKKSDPVSRYQSMQNSWAKNKFLSKHKGTKQGRKLDLAGFNQWAKIVQSSNQKPVVKQIHRYINPNNPLASNKRDDLRFHLRAKMSQEDYVDSTMKHFHYNPAK